MKTIIAKSTAMLIATALCATAQAQMNNVVEVETTIKPTVNDANKINVLPQTQQQQVKHYSVTYDNTSIPAQNYTYQAMPAAESSTQNEGEPRGFATFAGGNNGAINARAAYGLKLTQQDLLSFDASLRGHNANVHYAADDNQRWKSRYYTTRGSIDYEHLFTPLTSLLLHAGAESQVFNYTPEDPTGRISFPTDKQHNTLFDFSAALTPLRTGKFTISAGADAKWFGQKYVSNDFFSNEKAQETQVGANISAEYQFVNDQFVGIDADVRNITYSFDGFKNLFSANIAPHYDIRRDQLRLRLGAVLSFLGGFESEFKAAPSAALTYAFSPKVDFYAEAGGGVVLNDFRHFAQLTPYWRHSTYPHIFSSDASADETAQLPHQFDQLRAIAGLKWNIATGLYTHLRGGYIMSHDRAEMLYDGRLLTADGTQFFAAGDVNYRLREIFQLDVHAQWNSWSSDAPGDLEYNATFFRPIFNLDAKATLRPIRPLAISIDYLLNTYDQDDDLLYRRPFTHNLGASISYQLPQTILPLRRSRASIYLRADNLLNKHYDLHPFITTPGTTILGGLAVTF